MATAPPRVRIYATPNGRTPFTEWLEALKDRRGRARIKVRLRRISLRNFGDCKSLGGGLAELRVSFGPGYRIYFGQTQGDVVVLWGGEKRHQERDILRAREYWTDYRSKENG